MSSLDRTHPWDYVFIYVRKHVFYILPSIRFMPFLCYAWQIMLILAMQLYFSVVMTTGGKICIRELGVEDFEPKT